VWGALDEMIGMSEMLDEIIGLPSAFVGVGALCSLLAYALEAVLVTSQFTWFVSCHSQMHTVCLEYQFHGPPHKHTSINIAHALTLERDGTSPRRWLSYLV